MLFIHAGGTGRRRVRAARQIGAVLVAVASIAVGAVGCSGDEKETTTAAAAPSASAAPGAAKEIAATAAVKETAAAADEAEVVEPVAPKDLAAGVTEQLVAQYPGISVECPTELKSTVGATAVCVATMDGEKENLNITVTSIVGQTVNFDIKSA